MPPRLRACSTTFQAVFSYNDSFSREQYYKNANETVGKCSPTVSRLTSLLRLRSHFARDRRLVAEFLCFLALIPIPTMRGTFTLFLHAIVIVIRSSLRPAFGCCRIRLAAAPSADSESSDLFTLGNASCGTI